MDLFVPVMIVLVALTAVGQAFRWAQGWHREIDRLQEQARMRALAAQREQVAAYWNSVNRERAPVEPVLRFSKGGIYKRGGRLVFERYRER